MTIIRPHNKPFFLLEISKPLAADDDKWIERSVTYRFEQDEFDALRQKALEELKSSDRGVAIAFGIHVRTQAAEEVYSLSKTLGRNDEKILPHTLKKFTKPEAP